MSKCQIDVKKWTNERHVFFCSDEKPRIWRHFSSIPNCPTVSRKKPSCQSLEPTLTAVLPRPGTSHCSRRTCGTAEAGRPLEPKCMIGPMDPKVTCSIFFSVFFCRGVDPFTPCIFPLGLEDVPSCSTPSKALAWETPWFRKVGPVWYKIIHLRPHVPMFSLSKSWIQSWPSFLDCNAKPPMLRPQKLIDSWPRNRHVHIADHLATTGLVASHITAGRSLLLRNARHQFLLGGERWQNTYLTEKRLKWRKDPEYINLFHLISTLYPKNE